MELKETELQARWCLTVRPGGGVEVGLVRESRRASPEDWPIEMRVGSVGDQSKHCACQQR